MNPKFSRSTALSISAVLLLTAAVWFLAARPEKKDSSPASRAVRVPGGRDPSVGKNPRPEIVEKGKVPEISKVSDLLESLKAADKRSRFSILNEIGREMRKAVAKNPANFDKCFEMLSGLAKNDKDHLIWSWLLGAKSPSGGLVDLEKKRNGLARLGLESDSRLDAKLYFETGKNKAEEILPLVDKIDIPTVKIEAIFAGSLLDRGVGETVELFGFLPDGARKAELFRKVGPHLLAKDPAATIRFIEGVTDLPQRKNYITVLVAWLRGKGDTDSAEEWEKSLR